MPFNADLINGVKLSENQIYADNRGYLFEKYNKKFLENNEMSFCTRKCVKVK